MSIKDFFKDISTIVRFHWGHTHLAEDLFIIESESVLSGVKNKPHIGNVEEALKYALDDYIVPFVREYLQGRIDYWENYKKTCIDRMAENFNLATSAYERGDRGLGDRYRRESLIERKRLAGQTSTIGRYNGLLEALDSEGLEEYVKVLKVDFFNV